MAQSTFAAQQLRSFVHRLERMNEEIAAAQADRKEIYAEAKGLGFDTKIMRMVIAVRKMDAADYAEQQALLETYLHAVRASADEREVAHLALKVASESEGAVAQ